MTNSALSRVMGFSAVALSAAVYMGCAFSKDHDQPKTTTEIVQGLPEGDNLLSTDFTVTAIPQHNLNDYVARISWPEGKKTHVNIEKDGLSTPLDGQRQHSFDIKCSGGDNIDFKISVRPYHSDGEQSTFPMTFQCPIDLIILGQMPYVDSLQTQFGRVLFKQNSVLNLNGKDLDWQIDDLQIEESAMIESFDPDGQRTQNAPGAAPTINLKVKKVTNLGRQNLATLQFNLFGLGGAAGESGSDIERNDKQFQIDKKQDRKGKDYSGGDILFAIATTCNHGSGGDGLDGKDGLPGGAGIDGMDSPELNLDVEDAHAFFAQITLSFGRGGSGGVGGDPIPGGPGGKSVSHPCDDSHNGKNGKNGSPGQPGPSGRDGAYVQPNLSPNINHVIQPTNTNP